MFDAGVMHREWVGVAYTLYWQLIDQGLKGEPGVGDGKAIQKDEHHGTELKFVTKGLDAVEQAHNKDVQVPKSLH